MSSSGDEAGGDVEEPVAQGLGFGFGQVAVEAEVLGPGQQAAGQQGDGAPGLVAGEVLEGEVGESAVLPVPDPVFDSGVASVAEFQGSEIGAGGVGDETGVPPPVLGVEQGELGAGWGRSRRQISRVPGGQVSRLTSLVSSIT